MTPPLTALNPTESGESGPEETYQLNPVLLAAAAAILVVLSGLALPYLIGGGTIAAWALERVTGLDAEVKGGGRTEWAVFSERPHYTETGESTGLMELRIEAEDVVLRLPKDRFLAVSDPEIVRVARINANLEIWPLILGDISAPRIELVRPQVNLERDAEGRRNWIAADAPALRGDAPGGGPSPGASRKAGPVVVLPDTRIDSLVAEGATLRYRDARLARDIVVTDLRFDAGVHGEPGSPVRIARLRAEGAADRNPVYVEFEVSGLGDGRDHGHGHGHGKEGSGQGDRPAPYRLVIDTQPIHVQSEGLVTYAHPAGGNGFSIRGRTTMSVPSVGEVADMVPALAPLFRALSGAAAVEGDLNYTPERLSLRQGSLETPDGVFGLDVNLPLAGGKPTAVAVNLDLDVLDVARARATMADAGLLLGGEGRLEVPGEARLTWRRSKAGEVRGGAGAAALSWNAGAPNFAAALEEVRFFGGSFSGKVTATSAEERIALNGRLVADNLRLDALRRLYPALKGIDGVLSGRAEFLGVGGTADEFLAALSGNGAMTLTDGRLSGSGAAAKLGRRGGLGLTRASVRYEISSGLLKSKDVVLINDLIRARGSAEVDLTTGALKSELEKTEDGVITRVTIDGPLKEVLLAP